MQNISKQVQVHVEDTDEMATMAKLYKNNLLKLCNKNEVLHLPKHSTLNEKYYNFIPNETNLLIESLYNWFNNLIFLNYEIFNPNDSFGKLMVKCFQSLGCPLLSIEAFPSLEAHKTRLNKWFKRVEIYNMKTLYISGTDSEERKRIEKLEFMDEWEEWNIIQSHYFVSLAYKNDDYDIHLII